MTSAGARLCRRIESRSSLAARCVSFYHIVCLSVSGDIDDAARNYLDRAEQIVIAAR